MPVQKPVCSVQEIAYGDISLWEIDIALHYVDNEYTTQMDLDLFRIVFNTVQHRRENGIDLHDLACVVVDELLHESDAKRDAFLGGVMKVYNHRGLRVRAKKRKTGSSQARPKLHPFDSRAKEQRLLFPPRE